MARISFRQGIVRHQTDTSNNPVFLDVNGAYVDLVVSPDPTVIAFIHGDVDYLYTESVSVSQAWGPFTVNTAWLYWDLNLTTGIVTRGFTLLEPIESPNMPTSPATDQMWFNTQTNKWSVYTGSGFREVVRVFAARLENTTTLRSMSINAPASFKGTQVGITTPTRAGSLVFAASGKPVRADDRLFTTEDTFLTGVPTGAGLRVANVIVTGEAQIPLAAYQVVQYSDFNKIGSANPFLQGIRLFGIIEEDAVTNEVVNFVTEGMIYNPNWDWVAEGASANTPVYVGLTGTIELAPASPGAKPVGLVIGAQEILFAPQLFPQVTAGGTGTGATAPQVAQINQNSTDIDALEAEQLVQNADIATLETELDTVEGRLDTAEPTVAANAAAITTLTTDLNTAETDIATQGTELAALTQVVADNTTDIGDATTTATDAAAAAAANATAIAGKLDSVQAGTNVTIDATDPLNPIVNATGGTDPQTAINTSDIADNTSDIAALQELMLPFSFQDNLPDATFVAGFVSPFELTLETFGNHQASLASGTGGASMNIRIEGTIIGTVTYGIETGTGVVDIPSNTSIGPGEVLELETVSGFANVDRPNITLVLKRVPPIT